MTVDEPSSQDATLIDDDLVAALGFEPVTTIETANGHVDDADVVDEVVASAGETLLDDETEEGPDGLDLREDPDPVDDPDGVPSEHGSAELDSDEVTVDVHVETDTDEVESAPSGGSFFDLDEAGDDDDSAGEVHDSVIVVDEMPEAAPVELALDEKLLGGTVDDESDAVGEVDDESDPVIDLDDDPEPLVGVIDLDLEPVNDRLADADDVFADDVPADDVSADAVVADFDLDPATEDLDLVHLEAGSVALGETTIGEASAEPVDETVATAAAAAAVPSKRRRRLRARKSRRVIRHIDPWSVLTFSVLFHMCVFAAMLLSSVLVWNAATASGMIENIESFIQELGDYETFEINADVMFRAAVVIAGMLTLASSVMVVLLTVVFNLISDLVGGIRVTVIEEETVRVPIDKKRSKAAVE